MAVLVALAIAYVALVLVRIVAWRRLSTPRASRLWLFFTPRFFAPAALLWVAATTFPARPLLALVIAVIGLGYGVIVVRMVRDTARATATATTPEEFAEASVEPSLDYMLALTVFTVLGLIVFGLVVIVLALANGSG